MKKEYDVIIAGGGLAGLTCAILLSRRNKKVLLIEKKKYPFHKVCGEYVSNEVLRFVKSIGFDPFGHGASTISELRVSAPSGKNFSVPLGPGGFGLSRFNMDHAFYRLAVSSGAEVLTETKVASISFHDHFEVTTNKNETFTSRMLIGSYGKRDALDKKLSRNFIESHTGYMAVKYHLRTDYPKHEIGLDNFENGYCGIVKIEKDLYNVCYLYRRINKSNFKDIPELEQTVLFKNPVIKNIFLNSEFVFEQPEVINEISFGPKKTVEDHILMCGDSAGLITPLCGNGMSMAIHSAKILCDLISQSCILEQADISPFQRASFENSYRSAWNKNFHSRLRTGRILQRLFGNPYLTEASLRGIHAIPPLEKWLIRKTHGESISQV